MKGEGGELHACTRARLQYIMVIIMSLLCKTTDYRIQDMEDCREIMTVAIVEMHTIKFKNIQSLFNWSCIIIPWWNRWR